MYCKNTTIILVGSWVNDVSTLEVQGTVPVASRPSGGLEKNKKNLSLRKLELDTGKVNVI
jgi:hypothetical protein